MYNQLFQPIFKPLFGALYGSDGISPSFRADLLASINPHYSRTGVTPTFTRATTADVTDFEGITRTVKSGEARFQGARRVENLITASEDMTDGAYSTANGATVDSGTQVTFDGTAGGVFAQTIVIAGDGSGAGGRTFVFTCEVSLVSGSISSDSALKIAVEGNAVTNASVNIGDEVSSGVRRFAVTVSTDAAGTGHGPRLISDDAITIYTSKWQYEEVTGQTNQNPSEYVSTGVESSPYHGANVDGVKYFTTHNGNTVSGGVVTEATGPAINCNTSQWVELDGASGTYVSTPDPGITGSHAAIFWIAPDDLTPSSAVSIGGQWDTAGNQRGFLSQITVTGALSVLLSEDGTAATETITSSATLGSVGGADGAGIWGAYVYDETGQTIDFYYAKQPQGTDIDDLTFVALGTQQSTTVVSLHNSTAVLEIGSSAIGTANRFSGKIARYVAINSASLTATPAVTFNPNRWTAGGTWEDANDEVWTLQGNAVVRGPFSQWGDLPGSSGDYFSTPDSAAASVTSDLSLVAWAALDDWTVANSDGFISKWTATGNQLSYGLQAGNSTSGGLRMVVSPNGGSTGAAESTVSAGFADKTGHWVRGSWDDSTNTVTFYTSDDPVTTPYNKIAWTQLGDAVTLTSAGIFDGTGVVEVGSFNAGTGNVASGKIARAAVFDSTSLADPATNLKVDFDARAFTPGVSTAVTSTGETWTVNGNASIEGGNFPVAHWDEEGPLGYLSEGARTNIALYSTPGDLGTTWTNNANGSNAANYAIAPDGSKTAVRLIDNSATGTGEVNLQQAVTLADSAHTFSVHLKADQLSWAALRTDGFTIGNDYSYFDLTNGAVGTVAADHSATIQPVGGGWFRCSVTFTPGVDFTGAVYIVLADSNGDTTVDLDGTSSILVWGAQVEAGSFPSSYIPTEGSAVARNADVLTYSATGIADSFPMTVSVEAVLNKGSTGDQDMAILSINDGTGSNRILFYYDDGQDDFRVNVNAAAALMEINRQATAGVIQTITGVVGTDDGEAYYNGASYATDTSMAVPSGVDTIEIGTYLTGTTPGYGTIRNVKIYQRRLNDTQVAGL